MAAVTARLHEGKALPSGTAHGEARDQICSVLQHDEDRNRQTDQTDQQMEGGGCSAIPNLGLNQTEPWQVFGLGCCLILIIMW